LPSSPLPLYNKRMVKAKKKIGLVLGGGSARGLAHIGVLEVLEREGIPIDLVAGTSAGALVGALHAAGVSALEMKKHILGLDRGQIRHMVDLVLLKNGFLSGARLMDEVKLIMGGDRRFRDLDKPFACVACDIFTGEETVMSTGSVLEAVRASIAIPVVFTAVKRRGRYLIDGGLVNVVPVNVARAMGADIVIAVNVLPRHIHRLHAQMKEKSITKLEKAPSIFTVMLNTIDIANSCRVETSMTGADVIIEPHMLGFGATSFSEAKRMIMQGEMAAVDAVLQIKRKLNKI
jgi:NTE family protein